MGRMVQGANYDPPYGLYNSDGEVDVSSAEITYSLKETKTDDGAASITKQNAAAGGDASEIEMGPGNHQFSVHILPADTTGLENLDKEWWVEIEIVIGGSSVKFMETLYIEQSLTA